MDSTNNSDGYIDISAVVQALIRDQDVVQRKINSRDTGDAFEPSPARDLFD